MHTCSWYIKCEYSAPASLQVFSKSFQRNITVLCIDSNKNRKKLLNLQFYLLLYYEKLIQSYYYSTIQIIANIRKCSELVKVIDLLPF